MSDRGLAGFNTVTDFNAPPGPAGMPFPQLTHVWADTVLWVVVAGLAAYALAELVRKRSALGLVMLVGGGLALFNEPVDDILGLVGPAHVHHLLRRGALAAAA
jgi:hypothetical protein